MSNKICLNIFSCWQLIHFVWKTYQKPRVCRMNKTCWAIVVFCSQHLLPDLLALTLKCQHTLFLIFPYAIQLAIFFFCHILVLSFILYFYHSKESSDFSLQIGAWMSFLLVCFHHQKLNMLIVGKLKQEAQTQAIY